MQKINSIIRKRIRIVRDVEAAKEALAKNHLLEEEAFYHTLSETGVRMRGVQKSLMRP